MVYFFKLSPLISRETTPSWNHSNEVVWCQPYIVESFPANYLSEVADSCNVHSTAHNSVWVFTCPPAPIYQWRPMATLNHVHLNAHCMSQLTHLRSLALEMWRHKYGVVWNHPHFPILTVYNIDTQVHVPQHIPFFSSMVNTALSNSPIILLRTL